MPIDNLGKKHFSQQQLNEINQSLETVTQYLMNMSVNLNATERRKYGKVGEQNKLLINSVKDFGRSMPEFRSPEVDWAEFDKDYENRAQASQMLAKVKSIETLLMNIKILNDYDNYSDSLRDYQYAKYKNRFANESGYAQKIDKLKSFFPKTGKKKNKKDLS